MAPNPNRLEPAAPLREDALGVRALPPLLRSLSWPYLRRHHRQVLLVVGAVALGVSTIVASGSLIESSVRSVERAQDAAASLADLRISNGFSGVLASIVDEVARVEGVEAVGGIILSPLSLRLGGVEVDLQLVAVDLLGELALHDRVFPRDSVQVLDEADFVTRADAITLPRDFAERHGVSLGDELQAMVGGHETSLHVSGIMEPTSVTKLLGGELAIIDLPAAQALLGREDMLDGIDVKIRPSADLARVYEGVEEVVGSRALVTLGSGQSSAWRSLLFNIRLTLGLTGAISLVLGGFVIYHAVGVAITRRKPQIDVVRSLGASQRSITLLMSLEGLALGLIGSVLGAIMGVGLAWIGSGFVSDTVGMLYAPLSSPSFALSRGYLLWGAALGVTIAWAACVAPALSAVRVTSGLRVTTPSVERRRTARRLGAAGLLLALTGLGLPALESRALDAEIIINLVIVSDALVLIGVGLLTPAALAVSTPAVAPLLEHSRMLLPRLAWQGIASDPVRSAAVVTATLLGTAYVVYTVAAVGSIRAGLVEWLGATQEADLYITAAGSIGMFPSSPILPGRLQHAIASQPGVELVTSSRLIAQPHGDAWIVIAAQSPELFGERQAALLISGDLDAARESMRSGRGGPINQQFEQKHAAAVGREITIRSPSGPLSFRVEAVIDDYSGGDLPTLYLSPSLFASRWRDGGVHLYRIWVADAEDVGAVREGLSRHLDDECDCSIMTREEVRTRAVSMLDSIFYTAYGLELVAVLVTIAAMASFFLITLGERQSSLELLRSIGATQEQLTASFLIEAVTIGTLGAGLGCAMGLLLSWRFVESAMRLGAGLVFDFVIPVPVVVLVLGAAIVVSAGSALTVARYRSPGPTIDHD